MFTVPRSISLSVSFIFEPRIRPTGLFLVGRPPEGIQEVGDFLLGLSPQAAITL